jgi:hypothetical protein
LVVSQSLMMLLKVDIEAPFVALSFIVGDR